MHLRKPKLYVHCIFHACSNSFWWIIHVKGKEKARDGNEIARISYNSIDIYQDGCLYDKNLKAHLNKVSVRTTS